MIPALILVPAAAGLAAFLIRDDRRRRALLAGSASLHFILALWAWRERPAPAFGGWLAADAPGLLFLSLASGLFLAASVYALGYLAREQPGERVDFIGGRLFSNAPEARFTGCLLLFLSTMSLACLSRHFGLFWVAMEATTLASAPLIYFHRHQRSLEAVWKYLLLCSVGIALALLGNSFLAVAAGGIPLRLESLLPRARELDPSWLKAAFILFLVGYGTKMGLAPLHAWLPDAHSEAPSLVSALLSGALLNCSFLGILRAHQVLAAAGQAGFSRPLLALFGLLSMGVAVVFIQWQADFKRLLAYSSVEHMGIMALGVGLGGGGIFGAMLHAVNHSILKAMLFLVAGNILASYKTKSASEVTGALGALPVSGFLWIAGFLAVAGSPPFGAFLSELAILKAAVDQGRPMEAFLFLAFLALILAGMASVVLRMSLGRRPEGGQASPREPWLMTAPPAVFALCSLALGLWLPDPLRRMLEEASRLLGG